MPGDNTGWYVSDLAAEFQINPRTIRYYERIGLLTASTRTPAGYRIYSSTDRDRLRFILKAKATGLSLEEIREVLLLRTKGATPCREVLALVQSKIERLDQHVHALLQFREELVALQREGAGTRGEASVCRLIEEHAPHQEPESIRLATEMLTHRPVRARRS